MSDKVVVAVQLQSHSALLGHLTHVSDGLLEDIYLRRERESERERERGREEEERESESLKPGGTFILAVPLGPDTAACHGYIGLILAVVTYMYVLY